MRVRGGFTLAEAVIALAIVAVVAVLLLPTFSRGRGAARDSRCVGHLRQLGVALQSWAHEHDARLPLAHFSREGASSRYWWASLMYDDPEQGSAPGILPDINTRNRREIITPYQCPANENRVSSWRTPNYAFNRAVGGSRLANMTQPGRTLLLVDAGIRGPISQDPQRGPAFWLCYGTDSVGTFEWRRSVDFGLHAGGRANFLFVDGHVEALSQAEVAARAAENTLLWSRENAALRESDRRGYW